MIFKKYSHFKSRLDEPLPKMNFNRIKLDKFIDLMTELIHPDLMVKIITDDNNCTIIKITSYYEN